MEMQLRKELYLEGRVLWTHAGQPAKAILDEFIAARDGLQNGLFEPTLFLKANPGSSYLYELWGSVLGYASGQHRLSFRELTGRASSDNDWTHCLSNIDVKFQDFSFDLSLDLLILVEGGLGDMLVLRSFIMWHSSNPYPTQDAIHVYTLEQCPATVSILKP